MAAPTAPAPGAPPASSPAPRPTRKTPGLPPGPRMPMPVQTAIWARKATWMLDQCRARFGETFTLEIAHEGVWVFVTKPEDVKRVFTGSPDVLWAGEANRILLPIVGPHSLLLLDGAAHMSQRKLLLPPLHGERMKGYAEQMTEITRAELERWPTGEPYAMRPRMQAITLEIILRTVFGVREGERLTELRTRLREMLELAFDPKRLAFILALGPDGVRRFPPFRRRAEALDELIYAEIAERRGAADLDERTDILSLLLSARDEDGRPMSDEELRDELVTLLVAGHETTATSLAWALERLSRHPDKLGRLREEIAAGEDTYLKATITETLRLRPVISLVNRKLQAPFEIDGYTLPPGVKVAPCIHLVHRDPEIYPEPLQFRPERFLEEGPGTYTWIPFGGGVRRCIGTAFAQFEMEVVLRELIGRFGSIEPARPGDEPVMRRAITETPRHDGEVVLG
jgi:cytochrome P450 family 135